ncbi:MAG: hypothetical protein J0H19_14675 [Rhodospirillales bacterium]|nr:hypothetical protein [Rhodospirillales bacterium]
MSLTLDRPPTLDDLVAHDRPALMALFRTLQAPARAEMNGDFLSALPAYAEAEWRESMRRVGKDFWLGKSYLPQPHKGHQGHGHNRYRTADGRTRRESRFVWDIAPSTIDGNPSLVMRYAAFPNWGGAHDLIDEVRVVRPNLYLGLYHTATPVPGFTPRPGGTRSGIEFFILSGPVAAYVPAQND